MKNLATLTKNYQGPTGVLAMSFNQSQYMIATFFYAS